MQNLFLDFGAPNWWGKNYSLLSTSQQNMLNRLPSKSRAVRRAPLMEGALKIDFSSYSYLLLLHTQMKLTNTATQKQEDYNACV